MRRSLALLAIMALVALAACPGQRRALSRESLLRGLVQLGARGALAVPELEEVQRARVPPPSSTSEPALPAGGLLRARHLAAWRGDVEGALKAARGKDAESLWLRCWITFAADRVRAAVDACAEVVERAPGDPRAVSAATALARLRALDNAVDARVLGRAADWLAACAVARPRSGTCADLAFVVRDLERRAAARAKDERRAHAAAREQGALRAAHVDGPLAGDAFYAFASAGAGASLPDAPRRFSALRRPWDGAFRPAERSDGGLYRVTFTGEGGGVARLFVRSSAPARVLVDGTPVLERTPWRTDEPRVSRASLELDAGWHRVEVLAVARGGEDVLRVALLDDDGAPALRVHESLPARARLAGARSLEGGEPLSSDGEPDPAGLDALLARDHLAAWGLGVSASSRAQGARALVETFGYSAAALRHAAEAFAGAPGVTAAQGRADARPLFERVLSVWAAHPTATSALAEAVRDDRPDEALARYRAVRSARDDHPFGHAAVAELATSLGLLDEAVSAARSLAALDVPPARAEVAAQALSRAGAAQESEQLRWRAARRDDPLYSTGAARALLDAGETAAALAALRRVAEAEPGHGAEELLWDLLALDAPEAALRRVDAVRARFPNDRSAWRRRVQLLHATAGAREARSAVDEAIARFGADGPLWALREELGVAPPWNDRFAVGDAALSSRAPVPGEGHPAVMLLDHEARHVFEDLSSVHVRHFVVRLDGKEALDAFGELTLPLGETLLRLRVVKPDGRELLPELPSGVQDVSLTGLEAGDVVELLGVTFLDAPRLSSPSFDVRAWRRTAPVRERSYEVVVPARLVDDGLLFPFARNGAPLPERVRAGDRLTLRFSERDLAPLFDEPHRPHEVEAVPVVGWVASDQDAQWRVERGAPMLVNSRHDPFLEHVAERIAPEGTPAERFARLFSFVARRIAPAAQPASAIGVLASGRGQRGPLLLALARAARLDARPIAVEGPASPPRDLPWAGRWPLLGVAAFRENGGASVAFVDGGLVVLDELPPSARAARMLDLSLQGGEATTLPDGVYSGTPVRMQLDLDHKGDGLTGFLALTVPTHLSEGLRRGLRAATEAERVAAFEGALSSSLPGVRVSEVRVENIDGSGRPLGVGVSLEVPAQRRGLEPIRFEHLFADGASSPLGLFIPLSSYLQVSERELPLLFSAGREVVQVELSLPRGGAFTELPERADLRAGPVRLAQRVEVTDGTLFWTRTLSADSARVSPSQWPALSRELAALASRTDARVAFVVPEGERD
jgi:tetratricopeptide (TPR) repeat protein